AQLVAAAAELRDHLAVPPHGHVVDPGPAEPGPQHRLGHQDVTGPGRGDEDDLGRGGHRHRPEAVAGAGERGIGQREDQAAVGDGVAVHHVLAHRHAGHRASLALLDELDAETTGRLVPGHHRVHAGRMRHWRLRHWRASLYYRTNVRYIIRRERPDGT